MTVAASTRAAASELINMTTSSDTFELRTHEATRVLAPCTPYFSDDAKYPTIVAADGTIVAQGSKMRSAKQSHLAEYGQKEESDVSARGCPSVAAARWRIHGDV
jgi:hypothetical protein